MCVSLTVLSRVLNVVILFRIVFSIQETVNESKLCYFITIIGVVYQVAYFNVIFKVAKIQALALSFS